MSHIQTFFFDYLVVCAVNFNRVILLMISQITKDIRLYLAPYMNGDQWTWMIEMEFQMLLGM